MVDIDLSSDDDSGSRSSAARRATPSRSVCVFIAWISVYVALCVCAPHLTILPPYPLQPFSNSQAKGKRKKIVEEESDEEEEAWDATSDSGMQGYLISLCSCGKGGGE